MNRMPSHVVVLTGLLLCLAGCGGHDHADQDHEGQGQEDHTQAGHEPDHESHGSALELKLDNGQKWPVDESTRASAARLAELVNSSETIHSVADGHALGQALDAELDTLVQGCKMTGPAHDQLHVFLIALFPKVSELKDKADVGDLQHARDGVASLLEAYDTHFE